MQPAVLGSRSSSSITTVEKKESVRRGKSNSKKRKADSVDENRLNYQKQRCEEPKEQLKRLENGRFFRTVSLSL